MSAPEVNIPLLRKAVEWAEAEAAKPHELSKWEQSVWMVTGDELADFDRAENCGTCYCIAGFVANEVTPLTPDNEEDAPEVAARALGIESSLGITHGHLFYSENTIADVRRIAEDIAGERL